MTAVFIPSKRGGSYENLPTEHIDFTTPLAKTLSGTDAVFNYWLALITYPHLYKREKTLGDDLPQVRTGSKSVLDFILFVSYNVAQ
jgi:hypothetical protein